MSRSTLAAIALALCLAAPAFADEMPSDPVAVPDAVGAEPEPATEAAAAEAPPIPAASTTHDGRSAVEAWHDRRGWRYGTDLLFPFTRGMEEAGISGWARWPTALVSVPLDLALLPTGLLAGLFGG